MNSTVELAVRSRRASFNRALVDADLKSVGQILAPNAVLVTGTDSSVIFGRAAQLAVWKRGFEAAERTIYTRTTETVVASPVEPIAFEQGRWIGVRTLTKQPEASGTYAAKWRKIDADWVIEAEIYVTLD